MDEEDMNGPSIEQQEPKVSFETFFMSSDNVSMPFIFVVMAA